MIRFRIDLADTSVPRVRNQHSSIGANCQIMRAIELSCECRSSIAAEPFFSPARDMCQQAIRRTFQQPVPGSHLEDPQIAIEIEFGTEGLIQLGFDCRNID